MVTTVMIAGDQRTTRLGLALMIGKADDLRVIMQVENGQDAFDRLAEIEWRHTPWPDMVLMDVRMPVLNDINATTVIIRRHPGVKVPVLTIYDQDDHAFGALGVGTSGSPPKDTRTTDLHQALQAVTAGDATLIPRITWQLSEQHMPRITTPRQHAVQERLELLTPREREITGLVAQGMTNIEISERLFVQPESVKKTITRIPVKLQLQDWVQLVIIPRDAQSPR